MAGMTTSQARLLACSPTLSLLPATPSAHASPPASCYCELRTLHRQLMPVCCTCVTRSNGAPDSVPDGVPMLPMHTPCTVLRATAMHAHLL
eukprot:356133-Chlamydomonas_euryale.AAC.11